MLFFCLQSIKTKKMLSCQYIQLKQTMTKIMRKLTISTNIYRHFTSTFLSPFCTPLTMYWIHVHLDTSLFMTNTHLWILELILIIIQFLVLAHYGGIKLELKEKKSSHTHQYRKLLLKFFQLKNTLIINDNKQKYSRRLKSFLLLVSTP